MGSSPDGLIDSNGLVEIKCPFKAFDAPVDTGIKARTITCHKFDKKTESISLDKKHNYYFQVQGQLNISKRKYCLFVIYTGDDYPLKIEKIYRDQIMWNEQMVPKLKMFFTEKMLPEIINPQYPHGSIRP